jgi:photosystem II stability/assembly factor-like uncharacterized protein
MVPEEDTMTNRKPVRYLLLAVLLALTLGPASVAAAGSYIAAPPLKISDLSPFPPGCNGAPQTGRVYPNSEVEPQVDVNPTNSLNIVGAWQQDRWTDGGANSLIAGVSMDGGATWTQVPIPGITRCGGGGEYERATDPWVSFAPNGDVYFMSQTFNSSNATNAQLVSKSTDGGLTWSDPITLIRDTDATVLNDKVALTADPTNEKLAYSVWTRLVFPNERASAAAGERALGYRGPTYFARTTDGGQSWEPARKIYDPGQVNQTIANQIVVLPNGTLVNVFDLIYNFKNTNKVRGHNVAVMRSTDKGVTWSSPTIVSKLEQVQVTDPDTGQLVRTGDIVPDVAVDRQSGALYLVWQDARFSGGDHAGIAFSKSTDGGRTWSDPVQINQVPSVSAFTATVHVADDGTIGVSYYDFRNNTTTQPLDTDYWLVHSHDRGATWSENHIAGPFDMKSAPDSPGRGFFVGDYEGLTAIGDSFVPFFVQANSGNQAGNASDVYFTRVGP